MPSLLIVFFISRRDVLLSIFDNTNWCKAEMVDSANHIENIIKLVDPAQEYRSFVTKNK